MAGPKAFGPKQVLQVNSESNPAEPGGAGGNLTVDTFGSLYVRIAGRSMSNSAAYWNVGTLDGLSDAVDMQDFDGSNNFLAVQALIGALRNGSTDLFDRLRSFPNDADGAAITATVGAMLGTFAIPALFNGTSFDRARSADATNIALLSGLGVALSALPGMWSVTHTPAAATRATISRAAGAAGVRHVCTSIDAVLVIPETVNQPLIQLNLRDGATGAGTILWSRNFGVGSALAGGGQQEVSLTGLSIPGSAATAMTLEFSAAGAATTIQSVAMCGYDVS